MALKEFATQHAVSGEDKEIMTKHLHFSDVMGDAVSCMDRSYNEIKDHTALVTKMNSFLEDYNSVSKKPMNLVLFDFAILHVMRICRILKMARGNALLIGVGGSGR